MQTAELDTELTSPTSFVSMCTRLQKSRLLFCLRRDFPARAVAARQSSEQQLAEAKVEAAELGTELAALKQELKKVNFF